MYASAKHLHVAKLALGRSVAKRIAPAAIRTRKQHSKTVDEPRGRYSIPTAPPSDREHLKELEKITVNPHVEPQSRSDRTAQALVTGIVKMVEATFPHNLLRQAAMMETLGPVPGMVGTFVHRVRSAITRKPCMWTGPTMGEARREFVHFRAMLNAANAGFFGRFLALGQHGMWAVMYLPFYLLAPRTAHRFNAYIEEAAVKKYTQIIEAIDSGHIRNVAAPPVAVRAWNLSSDATLRDVALLIRADEADFREVHHHITDLLSGPRSIQAPKACDEFHIDLSPAGNARLHLDDHATSRVHVSSFSASAPSSSAFDSRRDFAGASARGAPDAATSRNTKQNMEDQPGASMPQVEADRRLSGAGASVTESMQSAMNPAKVQTGSSSAFKQDHAKQPQKVAGDSLDSKAQAGESPNPANDGAKQTDQSGMLPPVKSVQTNTSVFASPINPNHQAGEPAVKHTQSVDEKAANASTSRPQVDRGKHQQRQHARAFCSHCVRMMLARTK